MDDDAPRPSLNVHSTPRTAEMRELAARVAALEQEQNRQNRIAEILASAGDPPSVPVKPSRQRRPRTPPERRWLHVVSGVVPAALFASRWGRRIVAGTATAAVLTGSGLSADVMVPAPAAQVPARHHVAPRRRPAVPAAVPVVPVRRKRRHPGNDETVRARPPAAPPPSAAPSPSGTAPAPLPSPVPSVTVTPPPLPLPSPSPLPTCVPVASHHCHPDDVLRQLEGVTGQALRGLTGQP